jgi:hypothetical protein
VMPATGFAQTAAMSKLSWTPSVWLRASIFYRARNKCNRLLIISRQHHHGSEALPPIFAGLRLLAPEKPVVKSPARWAGGALY